ncbi:MAG TPA: GNAT family N-acetyltransferase [Nitrososphaerales archaeon]|nr:GNAT family N-acetyltransferase [Nitrososphaerales archaeon]
MSFIKNVWGGHDYIPQVWDEWLADPHGKMFVVEVGGVPVGMNRVQFLEDGSAWFEGVRVHPDFRGRGLATLLGENSMRVARERGVTVFRLTSGSNNKVAHRQIARIRFNPVSKFSVYEPESIPGGAGRARRAKIGELDSVAEAMKSSMEYDLGSGVFWDNYTAASLTPEVVRKLVIEGAVWRQGEAVGVTRLGAGGSWEQVCFIGGPPSDAVPLAAFLVGRKRAAEEHWVFVPQGSPIIRGLREKGFRRTFAMILFERRVANG